MYIICRTCNRLQAHVHDLQHLIDYHDMQCTAIQYIYIHVHVHRYVVLYMYVTLHIASGHNPLCYVALLL